MFFSEHKILCAFNSGHLVVFIFLFVLLKLTLKKRKRLYHICRQQLRSNKRVLKNWHTITFRVPPNTGSSYGRCWKDVPPQPCLEARVRPSIISLSFKLIFFQEMGLKTSCISPSPALSFRQHLDSPESILSADISQWKPVYPAVLRLPPTPSFPRLGHSYEPGVPKKTDVGENYKIQSAERTQRVAAFPARSRGNGPGRGGLESTEGARGSQGHRVDSCALSPQWIRSKIFMSSVQCPSKGSEAPAQLRFNHAQRIARFFYALSCHCVLPSPSGCPDVTTAPQPTQQPTVRQKLTSPNQRRNEDVWWSNDLYLRGSFTYF